jgi:protein phosphatase 1 regulatory subunit 21
MDLQNKYQILASEFSKVRGQVTVLKKAVIDEQNKNQQLQVIDLFVCFIVK